MIAHGIESKRLSGNVDRQGRSFTICSVESHSEDNGKGHVFAPEGLKRSPRSNRRVLRWVAPAVLIAAGAGAADLLFNDGDLMQRTVTAVRSGCTDIFKDPDVERREWRSRLAKRAVEIASGCECFTPGQKAEFERRLAVCTDDGGHMQLLQDIQDAADRMYFGEMGKHFPSDETRVTPGDSTAALNAADRKVPEAGKFVRLRSAAETFNTIGEHGMTLSLAIRRCERVLAGER